MTFSQATREYLPYKGHGVAISIERYVRVNKYRGAIQIEADILEAAQLCMEKIEQDDRQSRAYGKTYKMLAPFMSWQERLDCGEGVFLDAEQDRQWRMHLKLWSPLMHTPTGIYCFLGYLGGQPQRCLIEDYARAYQEYTQAVHEENAAWERREGNI